MTIIWLFWGSNFIYPFICWWTILIFIMDVIANTLSTLMSDNASPISPSELVAVYFTDVGFLRKVRMNLTIVLTCLFPSLTLLNFKYIYWPLVFLPMKKFLQFIGPFCGVYFYSPLYILDINLLLTYTWQKHSLILKAVCPLSWVNF